jgi:tetratricopeptide (TPR) repeat protein
MTSKECKCPFCLEPYPATVQKFYDDCQKERQVREQKALETQVARQTRIDPAVKEKGDIFQRVHKLIAQKKYDPALNLLFDIQAKYPNDPEIAFQLGNTFFIQQKYGLAVYHLMKAVKIDYKQPMAFYLLTRSFLELDLPDKAIWAAERALVYLNPDDREYREFCKNLVDRKSNPASPSA